MCESYLPTTAVLCRYDSRSSNTDNHDADMGTNFISETEFIMNSAALKNE